jgi:hypothetical protein
MVLAEKEVVSKRDESRVGKDAMEELFAEDLDVYTRSLNETQFESLVILLANRHSMTVKAIQRTLEYSYIFEFLEKTKKELSQESTRLYYQMLGNRRAGTFPGEKGENVDEWKAIDLVSQKPKILDKVLSEKQIKDKLLRKELDVFIGVQLVGKSFFGGDRNAFKNFMLSNDEYGSPEVKRTGVISEINKHSSLKIPSYNTVSNGLEELRFNGYLEYTSAKILKKHDEKIRTRANGVWLVTDIFYRAWNKRRLAILADYEKIPNRKDAQGSGALADFVEKYSARLLDIYLIKVSERIQARLYSSIFLKHQAQVAEIFRD